MAGTSVSSVGSNNSNAVGYITTGKTDDNVVQDYIGDKEYGTREEMAWDLGGYETVLPYHFDLGISIEHSDGGAYNLPDPSSWNYTVGDLDSSGSRDANGLLHRSYVATKVNYEFEWNALEWRVLQHVLEAVGKDKFTLYAPDPSTFKAGRKGDYYVGDRTGSATYFQPGKTEKALFTLKLKFIEY